MIKKAMHHSKKYIHEISTYGVWAISWASIFISLYYSEIEKLAPCDLCWWQRIIMYPLAILTTVAVLKKEFKQISYYVLPFGVIGCIVSFYHSLLQWGIITKDVISCSASSGVSCSDPEYILGLITIPFGAFLAFLGITLLSLASIYAPKFLLKDV
jgi:disulfide bond formation protein DsbB